MWEGFSRERICVRQHDTYDCGAASLCSVAAWYGLMIPLSKARELCGCTRDGITIQGIIEGARALGLDAKGYKSPRKDIVALEEINSPYIAHTRNEDGMMHFVVVLKSDNRGFSIMDPACGEILTWHHGKFLGKWSGYIIALEPGTSFRKGNFKSSIYTRLLNVALPHKKKMALSMAASFATIICGAANSFILQHLIDVSAHSGDTAQILHISAVLAMLAVTMTILIQFRGTVMLDYSLKIDKSLIESYIKRLFTLPANIFNQFAPGDLNSRIGDVYKIRRFISEGMLALPTGCATLLILLCLMFWSHSRLAVLSLLFIPLYAVLCMVSAGLNKRHNRNLAHLSAQMESSLLYGMDSIMTVRHFGREKSAIRKIMQQFDKLQDGMFKAGRCSITLGTAGAGLYTSLICSTLAVGGYMVVGGKLTTGELVSFYTLCSLFAAPLDSLVEMHNLYSQASVSAERLFEIIEMEGEEEHSSSNCPANESSKEIAVYESMDKTTLESINKEDIVVEDISFGYPGRDEIFNGFSTVLKAGRITAVCGGNGSGKSTFGALLMRDLQPRKGKISIGERDISSIPIREWRKGICIVPQKVFLFNDTILGNVACTEEEPDIRRATWACMEAGLAEVIKTLPSGICTYIGVGGGMLSGGEIQKLAIARALYRDFHTIIFDEATSNMDELSEHSTAALLAKLRRKGKRVLLVSHSRRLRCIADDIVCLG